MHRPRHWRIQTEVRGEDAFPSCLMAYFWRHYYLPLLAPPLPQEIPGTETPLASEELPACSHSPARSVTVVKLVDKMVKLWTKVSTHQSLLFQQVAGFFSLFAVLIFKLLKPGWG